MEREVNPVEAVLDAWRRRPGGINGTSDTSLRTMGWGQLVVVEEVRDRGQKGA